jgi:hypothetical protein
MLYAPTDLICFFNNVALSMASVGNNCFVISNLSSFNRSGYSINARTYKSAPHDPEGRRTYLSNESQRLLIQCLRITNLAVHHIAER